MIFLHCLRRRLNEGKNFKFNFLLKYTSLLRPPILESAAPGAELINKVEWKQVIN